MPRGAESLERAHDASLGSPPPSLRSLPPRLALAALRSFRFSSLLISLYSTPDDDDISKAGTVTLTESNSDDDTHIWECLAIIKGPGKNSTTIYVCICISRER